MTLDDVTRDYIKLLDDAPITFTWGGADYDGTRGALAKTNDMVEGGFENDFDLQIATSIKKLNQNDSLVDRFANGSLPQIGDKVTFDDDNYRIERVEFDPFTSIIQLGLSEV